MSHREVDPRVLSGLATMTAKESSKYALHGVRVEKNRMVATDGRMLAIFNDRPSEIGDDAEIPEPFILNSKSLKLALSAVKPRKGDATLVRLEPNGGEKIHICSTEVRRNQDTLPESVVAAKVALNEGAYPDYRSIENAQEPACILGLSVELMLKALEAFEKMGVTTVRLHFPKPTVQESEGGVPVLKDKIAAVWIEALPTNETPGGKICIMPTAL